MIMTMKKSSNIFWILIFIVVIILSAFAYLFIQNKSENGNTAEIYVDGELINTISLDEDAVFTVKSENGSNKVQIRDGKISIISSTCKNKVCISHGEIHNSTAPLVCIPNKLVIRVESDENDVDLTV